MADSLYDPKTIGLMQLAAGMMAGGQRSYGPPKNFLGILGGAAPGALNSMMMARHQNTQDALQQQQLALTGYQVAHAQWQQQLTSWWANGKRGPMPTPPAVPAGLGGFGGSQSGLSPSQVTPAPGSVPLSEQRTPPGISQGTLAAAGLDPSLASPSTPSPSMPSPSMPPQGGAMGIPDRVFNAAMANNVFPGAGAYYMQATAPVPLRQGPLVDPSTGKVIFQNTPPTPGVNMNFGPGGRVMSAEPIPNYAQTVAGIESAKAGAEAGARAPYQFQTATVGGHEGVPVSTAELLNRPNPLNTTTQVPRPMVPTPTVPQGNPADPWSTMPKLETPTGIGQTTYQKGRMQGAAATADELTKKTSDAAAISNERLVYNTQALNLVDSATSGTGALSIANVKNFLNSRAGVPLDLLDKVASGDANATTALNKDLINAATQKAKQAYGSRITQSEVMLQIRQASPNVDQMKATIRYLLQTDSAMSQYQIQKAQDLGKYLQNGGDPYQFEGWHSKHFPMSGAVSGIHLPTSEPKIRRYNPQTGKIEG